LPIPALIESGSSSSVPTFLRGLSEAYGFWKTICTVGRNRFNVALSASTMSTPSIFSPPDVGRSIIVTWRANVDLPQPDSPTTASVSPARTVNETPSSARTTALARNGPRDTT
jgi:hypothetical protein